jgi:hypothetical protein
VKIYLSQLYVEVGKTYPFSVDFQRWIGRELSQRFATTEAFTRKYSRDHKLIFTISAKADIPSPIVKGPCVSQRLKDVEFIIFLPHDGVQPKSVEDCRQPLAQLFESIASLLQEMDFDVQRFVTEIPTLVEEVISREDSFRASELP